MNMLNSWHFFLTYIEIMFKDNLRPGCKEITDQSRLKSFLPEIKFNLQHIYRYIHYVSCKTKGYRKHGFWTKARLYLNQIKLSYSH